MSKALLFVIALALSEQNPVGIWNLKAQDNTNRAGGGERAVLLKVQEVEGKLEAQITSIRNDFRDVHELRYEDESLFVQYGAYVYRLKVSGDRVSGTVESPRGKFDVDGTRQTGVLYNEPKPFYTTRKGVIGHRTAFVPPEDEADPANWVKSRIDSAEDLALFVMDDYIRYDTSPIEFTNVFDFEDELMSFAGRWVLLSGTWIGERIEIDKIEASEPPE